MYQQMSLKKIAWVVALLIVTLLIWQMWPRASSLDTAHVGQSTEDRSVFFRLVSKYQHGDEIIDFDIVVGCAVKVTSYGYGGSSYDAFRDPIFFVKATADGAALMQLVPDACEGETTETGEVPEDFLPGAIWFDNAKDLSLGVAYVFEDAFENASSKLRFLGATIHKATRSEWEAFHAIAERNLMDQRPFIFGRPDVSADEVAERQWDRELLKNWLPVVSCRGYARYRITDPAFKNLVAKYWPHHRPEYWAPDPQSHGYFVDALGKWPNVDGVSLKQYMRNYAQSGFATRARGGQFYSGNPGSAYPPRVYPIRAEDGVPWINLKIMDASVIYRDIDLTNGANAGLLYCYAWLVGLQREFRELLIPHYLDREFLLRVNGVPVENGASGHTPQIFFFERDEYLFRQFHFGLS
ncbi:MAG TPA: hypothetical protein VG742_17605 [Dongiaceae bacterium]|nr:hypothetical protein [Dongiaceae bacterium]